MKNARTLIALVIAMLLAVAFAEEAEKKEGPAIKMLIFREDCFESFFTRFDFFSDPSCIKFSLVKAVGFAVISGSVIYKVPQIMKMLNAGSSAGVSATSYYFESIVFLHTLGYSRHLELPFSVYGETISILVQQAVVIALIYHYDKTVSSLEKVCVVVFSSVYATTLLLDTFVPEEAWKIVSGSNIMFNILSRVPQIYANFAAGSTGVLSFVTFFLGWAGAAARLATVLIESDDPLYKAQFIVSFTLNTIIMLQFGLYWNADKGKTAPEGKKSPEKKDTKKTR